jgi:heterodisulfide reductase subunit C
VTQIQASTSKSGTPFGVLAAGLWALAALVVYLAYTRQDQALLYGVLAVVSSGMAFAASIVAWFRLTGLPRATVSELAQDAGPNAPITWNGAGFLREVERRSGTKLSACYQCHKCASGCPVGQDAELLSSQIMRLIHLGAEREVLGSRAIWLCASCQACSARCPMGIDIAAVMDTLRMMAIKQGAAGPQAKSGIFGLSFLDSVRRHGRAFELGLMAAYKVRSGDLFGDMDKAPQMFAKHKLSLFPKRSSSAGEVREAFKRSTSEEGKR